VSCEVFGKSVVEQRVTDRVSVDDPSRNRRGLLGMKRKYYVLASLSAIVIALDQFTKAVIVAKFKWLQTREVVQGFFNLTHVHNTGAAFGILQDTSPVFRIPFFVVVPIVALLAIGYIFRRIPESDMKLSVALSLVVGGAMSNLIDRIQWGYVVDFIDLHWNEQYHFPAFNIADSAISIGVAILMLDLLSEGHQENVSTPV